MDLLKSNSVKGICDHLDIFSLFNMLPHILLPMRVTETTSTIIDNMFLIQLSVIPCLVTLFILFLIISFNSQFPKAPSFQATPATSDSFVRDWNNFYHDAFINEFRSLDWDVTLQIDAGDPNTAFDNLFNIVNGLLSKYAPLKKTCKKKKMIKSNHWIIKGILTSISKRDHLYKSYLREKNPILKSLLQESFKKYRNKIVSLCRLSKSNFFTKYFSDNQKNIGKSWKGVKSMISLRSSSSSSPTCINIDNTPVFDPSIIAIV